jgi:hypothetical protein
MNWLSFACYLACYILTFVWFQTNAWQAEMVIMRKEAEKIILGHIGGSLN